MVVKERHVIAGAAAVVGLLVAFVAWKQVTAPRPHVASAPRSSGVSLYSPEQVQTISTGEAVDLVAHMPDQGRTIVEFTADW